MPSEHRVLTIRLSEMRDAQALMEIDALVWDEWTAPEPVRWSSREDYLRHCPPGSQLVAVVDGVLCGYIGFRPATGLSSNSHVCEINIAVHPDYQQEGIGSRLIEAGKKWAQAQGKRKLRLRVLSSNPGAIAFYGKCGFVQEGCLEREFCIGGRDVDDILMSCFLPRP